MCRSRMTFSDRLQKFYKKKKKQVIAVREDLQYLNTSKSREIREWDVNMNLILINILKFIVAFGL